MSVLNIILIVALIVAIAIAALAFWRVSESNKDERLFKNNFNYSLVFMKRVAMLQESVYGIMLRNDPLIREVSAEGLMTGTLNDSPFIADLYQGTLTFECDWEERSSDSGASTKVTPKETFDIWGTSEKVGERLESHFQRRLSSLREQHRVNGTNHWLLTGPSTKEATVQQTESMPPSDNILLMDLQADVVTGDSFRSSASGISKDAIDRELQQMIVEIADKASPAESSDDTKQRVVSLFDQAVWEVPSADIETTDVRSQPKPKTLRDMVGENLKTILTHD